jgi:hypothetical protein
MSLRDRIQGEMIVGVMNRCEEEIIRRTIGVLFSLRKGVRIQGYHTVPYLI